MFTDQIIAIINISCIGFLVIIMVILIAATHLRNGTGYAAMVAVTTSVPAYLANLSRTLGAELFLSSFCIASFLNVLCFPSLYLFVRSQLDKSFRFTPFMLLHALPAVVSLVSSVLYMAPMSAGQLEAERLFLKAGNENLPALINDLIFFGQFFIYFLLIFRFVRRKKRDPEDHYADSDYLTVRWIPGFLILFFVLCFIVFVAYVINPRTDAWLIPILNAAGMAYLIYNIIYHSTTGYMARLADMEDGTAGRPEPVALSVADTEQMKKVCELVSRHLSVTQAYRRNDLSLAMLSKETGIPQKTLSRSINIYLKRNFFELVNEMRIEEAKRRLLALETSGYKTDSIYEDCGFRSRSTFFLAFKKVTGQSPAQWLDAKKREPATLQV